MATIKEIADLAGVSSATVSRVLNYDTSLSVSDDTRQKIFDIADQLNYTKHKGKATSVKKHQTLAVLQWYNQHEELDDLYYYNIRVGLEKRAQELGYQVIRIFHEEDLAPVSQADGLIAIGKYSATQIDHLGQLNPNLVFVDSKTLAQGYSCVTTDFEGGVVAALDYFWQQGLHHIGMLTGEELTSDQTEAVSDPRLPLFQAYLTDKKAFNPNWIRVGHFSAESGYQMMQDLITDLGDQLPHAFFLASDSLAIGALKALQEANIPVPERVSLISFNDTAVTNYVYPALSSVRVHTKEMGKIAVNLIHDLLTQSESLTQHITLATELSLKTSTQ